MSYRMRALEEATAVPRSTIHFYIKEGLVDPPTKTARNAALYSERHRHRLETIQRLRSGPHPLPLALVRRALDLIDKGVDPQTAMALQQSVGSEQPAVGKDARKTLREVADEAEVPIDFVRALLDAGVLAPLPGPTPSLDAIDVIVVRRLADLGEISDAMPADFAPIAELLRVAIRLEMELRDRLVAGKSIDAAAKLSQLGQRFVNVWHPYLSSRFRLQEISQRGVGVDERGDGKS